MQFDTTGKSVFELHRMVLQRARDRIAQPGAWCQGKRGRGKAHCAVSWMLRDCWKWAEVGIYPNETLNHFMGPEIPPRGDQTIRGRGGKLRALEPIEMLFQFNDDPGTTQADVVALFDRAIARTVRARPPRLAYRLNYPVPSSHRQGVTPISNSTRNTIRTMPTMPNPAGP